MPIELSYIAELRRRIQDVRPSRRAITFAMTDDAASQCLAELTNGRLVVTPFGGTATKMNFDLSMPRYDTIGGLYDAVSRAFGYAAQLDENADRDHSSLDLASFGPTDCKVTGIQLMHHTFSDGELSDIIVDAIRRHNPSFTMQTLPAQEWSFVLPLAHAGIAKMKALDASKRRGLSEDVATLLQVADSFEAQYREDRTRLKSAIQSPKEADSNSIDEGDVVVGSLTRMSLRTGWSSPISKTISPKPQILLEPGERDVQDDNIRITWERNKDVDFYSYELWMDSTPEVIRGGPDALTAGRSPNWIEPRTQEDFRDVARRPTSSRLVYRSIGANTNYSASPYFVYVEDSGQLARSFAVGGLESETTYFFRLYVANINGDIVSSNVVSSKTKDLRARFPQGSEVPVPVNPSRGLPGSTVVVQLDTRCGVMTLNHQVRLGEKEVAFTILSPYAFSFVVPTFQHRGSKDLVVTSPNRLMDVRRFAFEVST